MALTFIGCGIKPVPQKYLNNQRLNDLKRVGIIIRIDSIRLILDDDDYGYAMYDYMPSSRYSTLYSSRFVKPLNFVYDKINSTSEIKIFYEELLKEKDISIKEIDYKLPRYPKFPRYPNEINEPSLPYDLMDLVNHFSKDDKIDAILIVYVEYRLYVDEMFHIISIVGGTKCIITSRIVDLNDSSIIYDKYNSWGENKIKGKWNTPPEYENLLNSFKSALSDAFAEEKSKLNW